MFTGIVEDLGEIGPVEYEGDFARVHVRSAMIVEDAKAGDSIAVNGVCLTITSFDSAGFVADVMGETLRLTSLKGIAPGTRVNLERAAKVSDRLGGHLVQGHVDGTGTVVSRDPQEHWEVVRISVPPDVSKYVARKGSITVDGISLTVSAVDGDWFEVSLIPETLKRTTLGFKQPGEAVNLEVDVIAKYVEKLLGGAQ
ncbi:MAG: riboflavin synthase [Streptosporangiales bacterium]|nr:riboflavin synthase [Streptosporangiales bacterium]